VSVTETSNAVGAGMAKYTEGRPQLTLCLLVRLVGLVVRVVKLTTLLYLLLRLGTHVAVTPPLHIPLRDYIYT
jgi:hypothetical protein